jgi:DNA polymerase-3 subunit beta
MKLKCKTEQLKNAIILAERMTGKNLTLPTLHAILIVASGNSLKIRSTNLAVGIEIEIPANIEKEGTILIKGEILSNVVSNILGKQEISLTLDSENLFVATESSKTIIKCLPQEDFPTLPIVEGESFEIKSDLVQESDLYIFVQLVLKLNQKSLVYLYIQSKIILFLLQQTHLGWPRKK